ncbi:carbon-nitrogen hydrolase [Trichoderma reesei RUT C-30]|uniref:nitrilase n=1 Tax=Hypocrea jecorina (strain ATCC 56765 / BCRC 32924 / NRRL 11460 / Rut C-30) TaxID=1344414 RepID=A0A024S5F7_HYPJR|nr:carbon-nitrogen hydrolase [Trichoderma reesei RUT C-30]
MPDRTVSVAVTQAEPVWLNLQATVDKTCKLIAQAASNDAQLIAFPEVWIPGYPCWIWARPVDIGLNVTYIKNSLRMGSPEMERIQACAREHGIAVSLGFSENDNNSLFISNVLIGADGAIKVHRRKMKPTHMERTVFGDASGHCLRSVAELPFGRVGSLSCWEHIQPLLKYNTISQKEEIHVAAWPPLHSQVGESIPWSMTAEGCKTLSRTYAIESGAFVLHCTAVISEDGVKTLESAGGALMSSPGGGHSTVFGPDGRSMTTPISETEEGIVYACLDMDELMVNRMFADCTGHYRRPDLLWLGVSPEIKTVTRWQNEEAVAQRPGDASGHNWT